MAEQLRLARIVIENVDARYQDVTVDLVFEGNTVRRGVPFFGVWQDRNEETRCPFVLDPNGEVDFGTGYDGQDRYYQTNIAEVDLAIGADVEWRSEDYDGRYKVVGVTQLV
jgi:hypothetical protein